MAKLTRVDAPVLTQAERIRANPHDGVLHIVGKLLDGMAKGNNVTRPGPASSTKQLTLTSGSWSTARWETLPP